MLRGRSLFLPICALILATVGSAGAQEFRATVKGQVADTSGAALPGATVTVQNQDTNEIATAVANTDGAYTMPANRQDLAVQRILVRQGFGRDEAALLMDDYRAAIEHFDRHPIVNSMTEEEAGSFHH